MNESTVIDSSAARHGFAKLGDQARRAPVEVIRHGKPDFVVISQDLYKAIKAAGLIQADALGRMQASFDRMVQGMQSSRSEAAYDRLEALAAADLPQAAADAYRRTRAVAP